MLYQPSSPRDQLVEFASRSPAVAGSQSIGRAEIRRAALRTRLSNTENSVAFGKRRRSKARLTVPGNDPSKVRGHGQLQRRHRSFCSPASGGSTKAPLWRLGSVVPRARRSAFACCKSGSSKFSQTSVLPPARPNTSLKVSPNGVSPSPVWRYAVHFRQSGLGATPLVPA